MRSVDELDEERWVKSEAARLARMASEEFVARSRPWSEELQKRVKESSERLKQRNIKPASEFLQEYRLGLGDGSRSIEGLSTGCDEIDHLIGGLNRFVLMAARAGTGKSTLAIQIALGTAAIEGVPVIYYSFEMSRANIFTMMMQNLRRGTGKYFTRNEVVLRGNSQSLPADTLAAINESFNALSEIAANFYVVDTSDGSADLERIEKDIRVVTESHKIPPLVIIDSIQDLVKPDNSGATIAEAITAQKIVELQQSTNATFLAISQKSKGGNIDDPYAGVLGSVAMIHKPTTVVELRGVHDLIRQVKDQYIAGNYRKLADSSDIPRPVVMSVLKGRNNGYGNVVLKHYGKFSYFETGKITDYNNGETSLYDLNSL